MFYAKLGQSCAKRVTRRTWIWNMRSPPLINSMTKKRRSGDFGNGGEEEEEEKGLVERHRQ